MALAQDSIPPARHPSHAVAGFVLAGGGSTRLGQDKVLLPWPSGLGMAGGDPLPATLLDHAVARLLQVCSPVRVCANRNDLPRYEPLIPDARADAGPLAGIVAALEQTQSDWNLFLAVDMPLAPVELLQALVERTQNGEREADGSGGTAASSLSALRPRRCILPTTGGRPQPLCALYHRSLAAGLRRALEAGKYKIMLALLDALGDTGGLDQVSRLARLAMDQPGACSAAAVAQLLPQEWFLNVNTWEDWTRATAIAQRGARAVRDAGPDSRDL